MKTKFIFVTGGVLSSLGKGLAAASLGALLQTRGLSVTIQKLDPYINVDPGTMNPFQHGEVFVTDDGAETDLDLGHYERYLTLPSHASFSPTKRTVLSLAEGDNAPDVAIIEIGGTVGDIEGLPFLEAIRQLKSELGRDNCLNIHLTLVPYLKAAGEHKTKPTHRHPARHHPLPLRAQHPRRDAPQDRPVLQRGSGCRVLLRGRGQHL